ncbi:MAG: cupin domain-containing protein [Rubrimonas sp.]
MSLPLDRVSGLTPADVRALDLEDWGPVTPALVAEGRPMQQGLVIVPGPTADEGFGVWRCTPYTTHWHDWSCDEFIQLIDGAVTIETEAGATTWRAGDSFFVPKGLRLRWVQTETVLKIYFIANAS